MLLSLPILQACATPTQIAGTDPAPLPAPDTGCIEFPRLTFDRLNDTLPTIAGIKAYDARRDAVCGAGK